MYVSYVYFYHECFLPRMHECFFCHECTNVLDRGACGSPGIKQAPLIIPHFAAWSLWVKKHCAQIIISVFLPFAIKWVVDLVLHLVFSGMVFLHI